MLNSTRLKRKFLNNLPLLYLLLVYLFLLGPLFVVIGASFNSAQAFPSKFVSFSMRWYNQLMHHDEFIKSLLVSTRVGAIAAGLALVLGIPLSIILVRRNFKGKEAVNAFFLTPLILPQVALSIATLQMFSLLKIKLSEGTLIVAHTVIIMPYVLRSVMASLQFVNISLEESAMNLGANPLKTFFHITLPLIKSGVTAGFILSFILSFINVPLSLFISSASTTTLPIRVFAHMESRLDPLIAAVGALTVIAVALIALFIEKVLKIRLVL